MLASNPVIRVMIEGHTDSQGRADYNLKLSDARANAVRDALIKTAPKPGALRPSATVNLSPLLRTTRPRDASNRRVEFNIIQDTRNIPAAAPE
ncbi:MAG: OmpA family protein [Myxococcota bacterium]